MALATAQAPKPETRKGRTVAVRPLTKMLINSGTTDSAQALRLQRLRLIGIIGRRADLLASLAWGEAA